MELILCLSRSVVLLKNVIHDVMTEDVVSRIVAVESTGPGTTRAIEEAGEEAGDIRGDVDSEGTDATANDMTVSLVFLVSVFSVIR
jgi:hypothetical protein